MLQIQNILKISKNDLKDLHVTKDFIMTVGREDLVCLKNLKDGSVVNLNSHSGNVNSITFDGNNVYYGSQNGIITVFNIESNLKGNMLGHTSNVCCLEYRNNILLSGSWDHTLKMWYTPELKLIESFEHPGTVWTVKFIDDTTFITGCADKTIRIFSNNVLISSFCLHNFCIRGISPFKEYIYSIDNEGTLLKTNVQGNLLSHYSFKDFLYDILIYKDYVFCCGENGRIYVLDHGFSVLLETSIPCISCWKLFAYDNKLYVCGSDGNLYVFGIDGVESKEAKLLLEQLFNKKGGNDQRQVEDQEFSTENGKFKIINNSVYQYIDGEWVLIGEKDPNHYDYSFNVELDNKFYCLSFNKNDNVFQVAEDFLRINKLNYEYKDQIVDYIKKNFKNKSNYKLYESINIEGVKKQISKHENLVYIYDNLNNPNPENEKMLEQELIFLLETGPRFVSLDLYRYFFVHGCSFDLTFLFTFNIQDRKEALAFVRLVTVLYFNPPFNVEALHPLIQRLRDIGFLNDDDLDDYYFNKSLNK